MSIIRGKINSEHLLLGIAGALAALTISLSVCGKKPVDDLPLSSKLADTLAQTRQQLAFADSARKALLAHALKQQGSLDSLAAVNARQRATSDAMVKQWIQAAERDASGVQVIPVDTAVAALTVLQGRLDSLQVRCLGIVAIKDSLLRVSDTTIHTLTVQRDAYAQDDSATHAAYQKHVDGENSFTHKAATALKAAGLIAFGVLIGRA